MIEITYNIIKKYEEYLTYWVSEKDEGQSDALNKGFNIATANWITWINSDDLLLPGALQNAALIIKNAPETKWISGNTVWIDAEDVIIQCVRLFGYSKLLVTLGLLPIGGPSTFFTKDLFREIGGLRKELVFTMDTDVWWRFQKYGARFHHVPQYLMDFRFHKDSKCSASSFLDKQKDKKYRKTWSFKK